MARLPLLSGDTPALMCHQVRTSNTNTKYNTKYKYKIQIKNTNIMDAINQIFLFESALDMKR